MITIKNTAKTRKIPAGLICFPGSAFRGSKKTKTKSNIKTTITASIAVLSSQKAAARKFWSGFYGTSRR